MSDLHVAPFFLMQGDSLIFIVKAKNVIGWSEFSQPNSPGTGVALIEDVPHKPLQSPERNDLLTSDLLLQVTWAPLISPEDGGAQILSYHLQYDDSSGGITWTDLQGLSADDVSLSFGVTQSIQAG